MEKTKLEQNTTQIEWIKQLSLLQFNRAKRAKISISSMTDMNIIPDANSSLPVSYWPNDPPCIQL